MALISIAFEPVHFGPLAWQEICVVFNQNANIPVLFTLNFAGSYGYDPVNWKDRMPRYIERRVEARVAFKSPIKIKNLKSGLFSNARMVNYCDNGLYFESNSALAVGAEIILGIENSPYSSGSEILDVYRAKILWRKRVQSTFYHYGYGAQLMSDSSESMHVNGEVDMRKHSRWKCNQSVCFFSQNQPHEGVVKNVCPSGLFIETREALSVGQTIELTIPDRKTHKLKLLTGEIVRSEPGGVGIRVKKKSDVNG